MAEKKNALMREPQVTFRASMLPFANFDDGSVGLAWPQSAVDAKNALMRFGNSVDAATGSPWSPEETFPRDEDAVLAGLAMTGSGFAGLGSRVGKTVSGMAREGVEPPVSLASSPVEAGRAPVTGPYSGRVYRGAAVEEQWPPTDPKYSRFFASDNPDVTSEYTGASYAKWAPSGGPHAPSVTPADVSFNNALMVDAMGRGYPEIPWQGGIIDTDGLANIAREQGHDGLVVKNVRDGGGGDHPSGPPSSVVVGLGRGTVKSPTTGETLFSNPKEAAPAGLLATSGRSAESVQVRALKAQRDQLQDWIDRSGGVPPGWHDRLAELDAEIIAAGGQPKPSVDLANAKVGARAYRGADTAQDSRHDVFWASSSPRTASEYAANTDARHARVLPVDVAFKNPLDIDAQGGNWRHVPYQGSRLSTDQLADLARKAGHDGLVVRNVDDYGPEATTYAALTPGTVRSGTTGETLFANAKEGAPAGLLATSGLERLKAEDAIKPRPFPDAPQTVDELESFLKSGDGNSRTRADEAWGEDPQRYLDYAYGMGQVMNPESEWWSGSPTLNAGGPGAGAVATAGNGDMPGNFDAAFAELHQALVDLDGDGVPDVAVPRNALMGGGQVPQRQSNALMGGGQSYDNSNFPSGGQLPNYGFGPMTQMSQLGLTPEGAGSISGPAPRPREYTEPLAEMTPPPIPGGGLMARAAPRIAGAIAGGLGLSAMVSDAGEGADSPSANLYKQQGALAKRLEDTRAKMDAEEANGGRGRSWSRLDAEARGISAELEGVNRMLEAERNSPERQQDIAKRAQELEAEAKTREARTPFRERYPNAAGVLPMAGMAIAGAVPFGMGAKKAAGSFFPGSFAGRVRSGIAEAEGAIRSGDEAAMDVSRRYLDNLVSEQPTMASKGGNALLAGASGGGLAAEAGMFPDQYDAYNLPAGPEQDAARERSLNPMNYLERGGIGTLTGLSGYKIGSLVPERKPNIARANALSSFMSDNQAAPAPASPQVITRSSSGTYHGPDGRFISPPRRTP
jgi:hypothetical protein